MGWQADRPDRCDLAVSAKVSLAGRFQLRSKRLAPPAQGPPIATSLTKRANAFL
jgi:hypothetical protein